MTTHNEISKSDDLTASMQTTLRHPLFTILFVVIILAVLGLAACTASNPTTNTESAATPELKQVIQDYFAAYNNYDTDALEAVVTESYMLYEGGSYTAKDVSSPPCMGFDKAEMIKYLEGYNQRREYQFETIGEPIVSGDGPWVVSQVVNLTSMDYPNGINGISTFTIVDEGGNLKVARDVYLGFKTE